MSELRRFKTYDFESGRVDGTLAVEFETEQAPLPPAEEPERVSREEPVWRRERAKPAHAAPARQEEREPERVSPLVALCVLLAVFLFVMTLLSQIQMMNMTTTSDNLEAQITELEIERDRLIVEYETVFNLKDVKDYAVGVLGMQEPQEDQYYSLTGVTEGDRAVVISQEEEGFFASWLKGMAALFGIGQS